VSQQEKVVRVVRPTTIIESRRLSDRLGVPLTIASETFQHTGSYKFRAAYNVVSSVPQKLLITASSGNFGQALAYACSLLGKSCIVVMPADSAKVKVDAVREFGGEVEMVDVRVKSRQERVAELAREHLDAYVASSYDDPLVIQGNSSLGKEISAFSPVPEIVVAPIGGGGLSAGIILGIEQSAKKIRVIGAEPIVANDAARSLRAGEIVSNEAEPKTIADGVRTLSVGIHNWKFLKRGLEQVVEVSEETIIQATRLLFDLANLKAEPTGALGIAALMTAPDLFRGHSVCCVVSGGNVDPGLYASILAAR
jgi:threonine dehydratase